VRPSLLARCCARCARSHGIEISEIAKLTRSRPPTCRPSSRTSRIARPRLHSRLRAAARKIPEARRNAGLEELPLRRLREWRALADGIRNLESRSTASAGPLRGTRRSRLPSSCALLATLVRGHRLGERSCRIWDGHYYHFGRRAIRARPRRIRRRARSRASCSGGRGCTTPWVTARSWASCIACSVRARRGAVVNAGSARSWWRSCTASRATT